MTGLEDRGEEGLRGLPAFNSLFASGLTCILFTGGAAEMWPPQAGKSPHFAFRPSEPPFLPLPCHGPFLRSGPPMPTPAPSPISLPFSLPHAELRTLRPDCLSDIRFSHQSVQGVPKLRTPCTKSAVFVSGVRGNGTPCTLLPFDLIGRSPRQSRLYRENSQPQKDWL